jgi:predicted ATPase/DNA-binding CsgD family transcriptional regulator
VRDRLRSGRMVTLTGAGGCGKTRLALRVAALAEVGFGDGARLVELAPLTDPALVPASIAQALSMSERDMTTPAAGLARALADRELLVVLDNCEHVLEAAAGLVATLLAQCRRVRFLATSRERLDVPGEVVFPVPPLRLPADGSAAAVAASEAGMLFAARAGAASPAFVLSADNSAAVAQVCARLDGIPLAIELAAARCAALGPAELAARLDGHPGLLSGGPARPGRHRSLEALVAWSYELLGDAERRLLARLSVLRGGFDLGMAEQVAAGGPLRPEAIAGLLASLAGKSVVRIHDGVAVRYSLLETIRQFAAGQLAASGEETAVCLRLLEWALGEARSAEETVGSIRWTAWATRLSAGQDSIRAALSWALGGQELAGAEQLAREATMQWHRCGDRMDTCDGIEFLGVLAAARERFPDAARLLAAAAAARRPLQYLAPGFTANRGAAARAASQARRILGDDRFAQAWEQGQGLTLDDAVAHAAPKGGGRKRPATGWASLTPAELEVVRLVSEGLRNDAIAQRLFIAPGTVKVHLSHIFAKLGITTRAELAARAAAQDLTAR